MITPNIYFKAYSTSVAASDANYGENVLVTEEIVVEPEEVFKRQPIIRNITFELTMSVLIFSEAKSTMKEFSKEPFEKCKKFLQTCKAVSVSEMPEVMSNTILIKWLESLLEFFVVSQKCVREHCVYNKYCNSKPSKASKLAGHLLPEAAMLALTDRHAGSCWTW